MNLVVREIMVIYCFKGKLFLFFFNGFVFLAELDNANESDKSWAWMTSNYILFVQLARRLNLMHKKRIGCICFSCPIH